MSDTHPATIYGALMWADTVDEFFGDEPPDMGSIALQTLAVEVRRLQSREAKLSEALEQAVKDLDELSGAREGDYDWEGVRNYAAISLIQARAALQEEGKL